MKKWVIIVAVVLAGIFLTKTTRVGSYAHNVWNRTRAKLERSIPREFEIERVRNDIARLDDEIRKLLRPIAEKMTNIEQMEKEIQTTEANLGQEREQLTRLTEEVASNTERVVFRSQTLTLAQARKRLVKGVDLYENRKANLEAKKRLLDAQRQSVAATHEQLTKLMEQKRDFSVRLGQIEAQEEINKLNAIAKPLAVDGTLVSDIDGTLKRLERLQIVDQKERDLANQWEPKLSENAPIAAPAATSQPVDLNRIRNVLGIPSGSDSKVAAGSSAP
jgi:chromosome segregation ATPase